MTSIILNSDPHEKNRGWTQDNNYSGPLNAHRSEGRENKDKKPEEEFTEPRNQPTWSGPTPSVLQTQVKAKQPSEKAEAWRVTRWGTERTSEIQGFWGKCKRDNGLGESWRINSKTGVSAPCRPWTEVHKQEEETDKLGRAIPVVDCWLAAWGQNLMFEHQMSHVEELVVLKFPVWNSPCGLCARMSQHEPKTYSNIVMSPSSYVALTTSRAPTNYAACWVLGTTRQH